MKKRLLSALCALCFAASLVQAAFAETHTITLSAQEANGETPAVLSVPAQTPAAAGVTPDRLCIFAPVAGAAVEIPISGDAKEADVLFLNSDGTYTLAETIVKSGGSVFTVLPEASATLIVLKKLPFTDVLHSSWYYSSTAFVYHHGLMSSTGSNKFSPNATVNRAMIATILWRQAGKPASAGTASLSDVAAGQYYDAAARWIVEQGIMTASGGKFLPNGTMKREELALVMYRYCRVMGYDVSAKADLSGYADNASISSGARSAVSWAVGEGLISGVGGKKISPEGTVKRSELATILMRFLGNKVDAAGAQ